MANVKKRGTISVSAISEDFYIRKALDEDHVIQLSLLYENGVKLPPVLVSESGNRLIDGRHRLAALRLLDKKTVDVEWTNENELGPLLVLGLQANIGGALPPTNSDIVNAMKQMLETGMQHSVVQKHFAATWPPAVTRKYLNDARWAINRDRITSAKAAILEKNMTVAEAAALFGVKMDTLKDAIQGKKGIRKSNAATFKASLTTIFKSRGTAMGALIRKVQALYEDGDISWNAVSDLLEHCETANKSSSRTIEDWRRRFEAMAKKAKKSA